MKNTSSSTIILFFKCPLAAPYFLRPGEELPSGWHARHEIAEIKTA